jgi:hypothetical protein
VSESLAQERPVEEPLPADAPRRDPIFFFTCYYCGRPSRWFRCDRCDDLVEERDE